MSGYEGHYTHPCFGEIIVKAQDKDRLQLEYGRFGKMVLVPEDEFTFQGYFIDKLWFVTNSDGNVTPYTISFVFDGDLVKEIRFPIDFSEKPTEFQRGTGLCLVPSLSTLPFVLTIGMIVVLTVS